MCAEKLREWFCARARAILETRRCLSRASYLRAHSLMRAAAACPGISPDEDAPRACRAVLALRDSDTRKEIAPRQVLEFARGARAEWRGRRADSSLHRSLSCPGR